MDFIGQSLGKGLSGEKSFDNHCEPSWRYNEIIDFDKVALRAYINITQGGCRLFGFALVIRD